MAANGTQVLTTAAARLNSGTSQPCAAVLVQADPDNAVSIVVGQCNTPSIKLLPGHWRLVPVQDVKMVWAKAASGTATVNWEIKAQRGEV